MGTSTVWRRQDTKLILDNYLGRGGGKYNLLLILALPTFSALASTVFSPFPLFAEPSALDDFANGVSTKIIRKVDVRELQHMYPHNHHKNTAHMDIFTLRSLI